MKSRSSDVTRMNDVTMFTLVYGCRWVLQCLDNVGQDSQCSNPPCAIVPLGTGQYQLNMLANLTNIVNNVVIFQKIQKQDML
jgi:hypothetical protein